MSRVAKLENLCFRIGILNGLSGDKPIKWGTYGYMLLNEIKSMWLSRSLNKHSNTYLVESTDANRFNLDSFHGGILINHDDDSVGVVSVCQAAAATAHHQLFKDLDSTTSFNMQRLEHSRPWRDSIMYWQNERLDWWTKFLTKPENMKLETIEESGSNRTDVSSSNLVYHVNDEMSIVCEKIVFKQIPRKVSPISTLVSMRTSAELILECVLFDSVEFPSDDTELEKYNLKPRRSAAGSIFTLDLSLAPFKLAILYKRDDDTVKPIAKDLKRLLYLGNVHGVLVYSVDDDQEALHKRYESLDLLGVPYSLYLPSCVTKDGFCYVRNRDTNLREKAHLSHVVKHFKAILDSLVF